MAYNKEKRDEKRYGALRSVLLLVGLIVLLLTLCPFVSAKYFVVDADPSATDPGILGYLVSDINFFTHDDFLGGIPQFPYYIEFIDEAGNDIEYYQLRTGTNEIDFDKKISGFRIYTSKEFSLGASGTPMMERSFSFCNNNGICEPCYGKDCTLIENYLSCSDCKSGSKDFFCDLKSDGICDPDCENIDGDCTGCVGCVFDGMTCDSLGGYICDKDESCSSGKYAENLMVDRVMIDNCCIEGFCQPPSADDLNSDDIAVEDAFPKVKELDEYSNPEDIPGVNLDKAFPDKISKNALPDQAMMETGPNVVLYSVIGFIIVSLVVSLLIFIHKRNPLHTNSQKTSDWLQQQIDQMVAQRMTYAQIDKSLKNKGINPELVSSEIKKNYDRRKQKSK